jgi:hypothetical protein
MPSLTSTSISTLGDKICNISLASLSRSLKKSATTTTTNNNIQVPASSENTRGQLEINIVEGRNLTIKDASKADTYCIVHYEGNVTSTLDEVGDESLPYTPLILNSNVDSGAFRAFEIMMDASSPK